jgi:hypothetical protein
VWLYLPASPPLLTAGRRRAFAGGATSLLPPYHLVDDRRRTADACCHGQCAPRTVSLTCSALHARVPGGHLDLSVRPPKHSPRADIKTSSAAVTLLRPVGQGHNVFEVENGSHVFLLSSHNADNPQGETGSRTADLKRKGEAHFFPHTGERRECGGAGEIHRKVGAHGRNQQE